MDSSRSLELFVPRFQVLCPRERRSGPERRVANIFRWAESTGIVVGEHFGVIRRHQAVDADLLTDLEKTLGSTGDIPIAQPISDCAIYKRFSSAIPASRYLIELV